MADIFLSYAREDLEQARRVATALEAEGWSVFWDRRIPPGRNFEEHLEQEIRSSRAVVVLWSPQSVASAWVKIEAAQGRDSDILIPILIAPANIPFGYGHIHAADLSAWGPGLRGIEFEELVRAIERVAPRVNAATADGQQRRDVQQSASNDVAPRSHADHEQLPSAAASVDRVPATGDDAGGVGGRQRLARFEYRALVALVLLIAAVGFTTLWHPGTDISASITARELEFPYRPPSGPQRDPESTSNEKQLLIGNSFEELTLTPFESIVFPADTKLSVEQVTPDGKHAWIPVATQAPVQLVGTSKDAKAIFQQVTFEGWGLDTNTEASVSMASNVQGGKQRMNVSIDGVSKSVSLVGPDSVVLQCQLCRIEKPLDPAFARSFRTVDLKVSGLFRRSFQATVAGSALTLILTPGSEGLKEEFRFRRLRFCGGTKPPDARSTVVTAKMTFPVVDKTETVLGEGSSNLPYSALRLDADHSFLATQLALVDGGEDGAIKLDFHGRARTAVLADECDGAGTSILPTLFDDLSSRPYMRALGIALGFALFWLASLGKLWGFATRAEKL